MATIDRGGLVTGRRKSRRKVDSSRRHSGEMDLAIQAVEDWVEASSQVTSLSTAINNATTLSWTAAEKREFLVAWAEWRGGQ